jgi:hypothetical protein
MINKKIIFILLCILTVNSTFAQDIIRNKPCNSEHMKSQADSVKDVMAKSGFALMREASMSMESEYEMPVIVPFNDGSWYQIVFIGDESSRLIELRMLDWEEKQVVYQKSKNDRIVDTDGNNSNILSYTYISKFTEYHMIKPLQVNRKKKKDICGYIMLFKRTK